MRNGKVFVLAVAVGLGLSIATLAFSRTKYEMRSCPALLQSACGYYVNVHGRGLPLPVISKVDKVKIGLDTAFPDPTQKEINKAEVTSSSTELYLKGVLVNWLTFSVLTLLVLAVVKPVRKKFY